MTLDQIKRSQRIPNRCYICKAEEEIGDHILIHCMKARILWHLIYMVFGVQLVMHSSIRGVLLSWCGSFVGKEENKGLEGCSVVLVLDHMKGEK